MRLQAELVASIGAPPFPRNPRFELVRPLSEGSMGIVFEAFDRERNCRVALKTLHTLTAYTLVRFKNEFRALHDLAHPNLVSLDQLFELDGDCYFTMELIRGVDFLRWVRPGREADVPRDVDGGFDEPRLRAALAQLAQGLCALHAAGKVHRDIKPSNVLVTAEGRVVILDFGLVARADQRAEADGVIAGTMTFMAPEQAASEAVGAAADWYAVGVMLYLTLTGRVPFAGTPPQILEQKLSSEPLPPRQLVAGVPADLDAICQGLLRRRPEARLDGAALLRGLGVAASPAHATPTRPLFIGRKRELDELGAAWQRAVAGRVTATFVTGESGVGKTALVRRFMEELNGAPIEILTARCYERESAPYKAVDEVIVGLSQRLAALPADEVAPLLPERIGLAAAVFPALARVPAVAAAYDPSRERGSAEAAQTRAHVLAAIRELFLRVRARHPILIAIDDLQWADPDSLSLLAFLMTPPEAPPILFCATLRAGHHASAALTALRTQLESDLREVVVERLAPVDACALAESLLAAARIDPRELRPDHVAELAGGHPLFIDALVRHRVADPTAAGPRGLDDALLARAAALDPAAGAVLEIVCVAGQPIAQEVCAHAAGIPFGDFVALARLLKGAHLVRTHGVGRRDLVEPYHDRVRESVVARLPPSLRRDLHARLAFALRDSGDADPEALAFHFEHAGDARRAARHARIAADRAAAALAFAQAARLYERALALDAGLPAHAHRLRLRLADALANCGRGGEAAEIYLECAGSVSAATRAELLCRAAEALLTSGRIDAGMDAIRTVLSSVGMSVPETERAALCSFLFNRARGRLRGLPLRHRLQDPDKISPQLLARLDACWSVCYGLAIVDTVRSIDFQARHLLLAGEAGEPRHLVRALSAEAMVTAAMHGSDGCAERVARAAESLAEQLGDWTARGYAAFAVASIAYFSGRWRQSHARCDHAEAILRDRCRGVQWFVQTARHGALESLWYAGELRELSHRVPLLLADAQSRGDLYAMANLQIGIPNVTWLIRDDVEGARRHAAAALASWSRHAFDIQHLGHLFCEVQTDLYAGDGAAAHQRVVAAWPGIRSAYILRMELSRISTHHLRGRAALAAAAAAPPDSRRRRQLMSEARRAAAVIARHERPWSAALAALLRAGLHRLADDVPAARRELDAAIAGFVAAGMALYAAAARLRRGELSSGAPGASLVEDATVFMQRQGIRRPDRMTALLAPGFLE